MNGLLSNYPIRKSIIIRGHYLSMSFLLIGGPNA